MKFKRSFLIIILFAFILLSALHIKFNKNIIFSFFKKINILTKVDNLDNFLKNNNYHSIPIVIPSKTTESLQEILNIEDITTTIKLYGNLLIPKSASGKTPAVIFAFGGARRMYPNFKEKVHILLQHGISVLIMDSSTKRNRSVLRIEKRAMNEPTTLFSDITDAFAALYVLSKHPKIDKRKIGIIGFSIGGSVSIFTAWKPIIEKLAVNNVKFAFHISFYPFCFQFEHLDMSEAPMLLLIGEKDNWALPQRCYTLFDKMQQLKYAVTLITYPNAIHAFDIYLPERIIPNEYSGEKCKWMVKNNGELLEPNLKIRVINSKDFIEAKSFCGVKNKVTNGGNLHARNKSQKDMMEFIKTVWHIE